MKDNPVINNQDSGGSSEVAQQSLGKSLFDVLGSVKFAVIILVLISVACIAGTLLPQGRDVVRYIDANPGSERTMQALDKLGLTHVYSAGWFTGLLFMMSCCLAVCTFRRIGVFRRVRGRAKGRALGSVITHISLLFVFAGAIVRGVAGEKGVVELRAGDRVEHFMMGIEQRKLPFVLHLAKFDTEFYSYESVKGDPNVLEQLYVQWKATGEVGSLPVTEGMVHSIVPPDLNGSASAVQIGFVQRIKDFVVDMETRDVYSRSDQFNNPALLVQVVTDTYTNSQWLFALHPELDMHADRAESEKSPFAMRYVVQQERPRVKDWKSTLEIVVDGKVVVKKVVEVNAPLRYKGYSFYQMGYRENDPSWTSLQVVRDPGVPVVYAGFILMIVGLTMIFYVYPPKNTVKEAKQGR